MDSIILALKIDMDSQSLVTITGNTAAQSASSIAAGAEQTWHRHMIRFLPIAALYLVLGFYQIDDQSLWTDEVISLNHAISTAPTSSLLFQSQSPLYFALLQGWVKLAGTSEFALRSFSALIGLAALGLTYSIGFRLFNQRVALIAAVLLATSPYMIWYAQEVRYITFMLTTSLLMTYFFHRAVSDLNHWWWLAYGVSTAMALFTFITAVFIVLVHAIYVICLTPRRASVRKWLLCQLIVFLLFGSWFVARYAHRLGPVLSETPALVADDQGRSHEKLPSGDLLGSIPYTFFAFTVGFTFGPSVPELHQSRSFSTLSKYIWMLVPVGLFFTALFVFGARRLLKSKDGRFMLLWLGVPIVGVFFISALTTFHVYNTRYVAIALPAYMLVLATAIEAARGVGIQAILTIAILSVNGISLVNYYFNPRYSREDARSAAQFLQSSSAAGDVIVAVGSTTALRHYYNGALPIVSIDGQRTDDSAVDQLRPIVFQRNRVQFVEIRPWETDRTGSVKAALERLAWRRELKAFPGASVYTYYISPELVS